MGKPSAIFLLVFFTFSLHGQNGKSFIIQVRNEVREFKPNKNFKRSATVKNLKQICRSPLNLWVMETHNENATPSDLYRELSSGNEVLMIKENKKITNRNKPNDPSYNLQWQYKNDGTNSNGGLAGADINIEAAWDITTGGNTVFGDEIVVAVADDGLNLEHPDMVDNLWTNIHEVPNDNMDNDGNGYVDDVHGWNVGTGNDDFSVGGGHGTPVAGIVGASGNNGIGVSGVNWKVKIMPIDYGFVDEAGALGSYAYAYTMRKLYNQTNGQKGAFVVATNSSWGIDYGDPEDAPLWCAFYDSLGTVGILSAGATANQNVNVETGGDLPTGCESDFLIAVTNLNRFDNKVTQAGYGNKSVDLGAYGEGAYTVTQSSYGSFGGTSGATPHVSGTIALMYSVMCSEFGNLFRSQPALAALTVKDLILNNTTANASLQGKTTTGGKLNVGKAIKAMDAYCSNCAEPSGVRATVDEDFKITIAWQSKGSAVKVRIKEISSTTWSEFDFTSAQSFTTSSLNYCSEYEYQLKYLCNSVESDWAYSHFVKTNGCCLAPELKVVVNDQNIQVVNPSNQASKLEYKFFGEAVYATLDFTGQTEIQALNQCSSLSLRASQYCSLQDSFSVFSQEFFIPINCENCTSTAYCIPDDLNNEAEWIDSVTIGSITNVSARDQNAYGNYLGAFVPEVTRGEVIPIRLIPGYDGTTYNEVFSVYVDWNQNQELENSELVITSPVANKIGLDSSFMVPLDAKSGYTRLRIVMNFREGGLPCDNSEARYGEVEDYCIRIKEADTTAFLPIISKDRIWYTINKQGLNMKYRFNTDSVKTLNGKNYYQLQYANALGDVWVNDFPIREEKGILYFYENGGDHTFYDFNLTEGDSILFWIYIFGEYYHINKVDTITLNDGKPRKRIHLQDSRIIWIEGIGSLQGPFNYIDPEGTTPYTYLSCYYEDDVLIYENTEDSYGCTTVSTNEIHSTGIYVYPNPSSGIFTLESDRQWRKIEIYDIHGKQLNMDTSGKKFDLSDYPNGVYQMVLQLYDWSVVSLKLVKMN